MAATNLPEADFGISGLDQILAHGVPRETLLLLQGVPGSGKTTLALQFLLRGVAKGESSLLVSNAETPAQIERVAASHGWTLDGLHVLNWSEQGGDARQPDADDYTLFPEAEVEVGEAGAGSTSSGTFSRSASAPRRR